MSMFPVLLCGLFCASNCIHPVDTSLCLWTLLLHLQEFLLWGVQRFILPMPGHQGGVPYMSSDLCLGQLGAFIMLCRMHTRHEWFAYTARCRHHFASQIVRQLVVLILASVPCAWDHMALLFPNRSQARSFMHKEWPIEPTLTHCKCEGCWSPLLHGDYFLPLPCYLLGWWLLWSWIMIPLCFCFWSRGISGSCHFTGKVCLVSAFTALCSNGHLSPRTGGIGSAFLCSQASVVCPAQFLPTPGERLTTTPRRLLILLISSAFRLRFLY